MSDEKNAAVITLLANDALEAANDVSPLAAILLLDAALSILATRIRDRKGRLELAGMLAAYVVEQTDALGRAEGAA